MKFLFLMLALPITACQQAPTSKERYGSVYGYIRTEAHADYKAKHRFDHSNSGYRSADGGSAYQKNMVDYDHLSELYACLSTNTRPSETHQIQLSDNVIKPHALAISPGDKLKISNNSNIALTPYISAIDQNQPDFQGFTTLLSGQSKYFDANISGQLILSTEENEQIHTIIWSKNNLHCKQLSSNDFYNFTQLEPGKYEIIFWYWRMGMVSQTLNIQAGKEIRLDKTLSIDKTVTTNKHF